MSDLEAELKAAQEAETSVVETAEVEAQAEEVHQEPIQSKSDEITYSDIEQQAIEQGWVPPEKFKGPKEDAVSAEVYLARGPLMSHISKLNKKLEEQGKTFQEYLDKVKKTEYEKARKELEAEREKAIINRDVLGFKEVDEKLQNLNKEAPQVQPQGNEAVNKFKETNSWFSSPKNATEKAMQAFAIQASNEFVATIGGDVNSELDFVMKQVKDAFPKHFEPPAKQLDRGPDVVAPSNFGKMVKKTSLPDARWTKLSDGQRSAAMQLKDFGVSIKEYIDTLEQSGDL